MRDINRIMPLMEQLGNVWEQFPDLRFMQFIVNFQTYMGSDCFYMEDDQLIERICEFATDMIRGKF